MKSTLLALILAGLFAVAAQRSQAPSERSGGCTLIIHVTGVRNQKGDIGATLFTSAAGWPEDNDKAYVHGSFPISGDHATITIEHLPPARYGVAVLHDENRNHKLDRNFLKIPKEGFGFANNPHVGLSAPKWDDAAVDVGCPSTEITISLIYK